MELTNKEREENNEFNYYTKQGIPVEELDYMFDRHDRFRPPAEINPETKNKIIQLHKQEKKRIRDEVLKGDEAIAATNTRGFGLPSPEKKSRKKRTDKLVGEWRPFYIPPNIPKEPRADLQFTTQEFQNYHVQNPEVKGIIKHMHNKKKTVQGRPLSQFKLKKGKIQKPVKGGRRRRTRKKRGGWSRWDLSNIDDNGQPYYDCPGKQPLGDWRYKEGVIIRQIDRAPQEAQEIIIEKMEDTGEFTNYPMLVMNHRINPHEHSFRIGAHRMCWGDYKPLKKNQAKTGAGRKKKTRRKRTRMRKKGGHHLYKRLGVSKYASQKQIKNSYTKLKKKNKASRKVKEAYKILSNKKTRKQYNNRYKKFVKTKKR